VKNYGPGNTYGLSPSLKIDSRGRKLFLSWTDPVTGAALTEAAGPDELLGLKIVGEGLSLTALSREHGLPVRQFYGLLSRLDRRGILKAPSTLLRRDPAVFNSTTDDVWLTATTFSLQLHVTNACNLHCRHCYDRAQRAEMTVAQANRVMDELERFCKRHWVEGVIDFSGGNPFLHRGFPEMYQEAARRGYELPIIGNPVSREQLEAICSIKRPSVYQVSLEGRRTHNDWIRGAGSYDRAMAFLSILRETAVESAVMLTLTAGNISEVLPLAAVLEGRTDAFCFSRLSRSGEGANLAESDPASYRALLKRYVDYASRDNICTFKENLISLTLAEKGQILSDGCTGVGCGAAFNCLSVLPDGGVYACRKFPSLVGNIYEQSLEEIYFSAEATQYRRGMRACDGCPLRHACGGCMAVAKRPPGDISAAYDHFCWRSSGSQACRSERLGSKAKV
jgi:selenobiotic family peptide radical SAM maturase